MDRRSLFSERNHEMNETTDAKKSKLSKIIGAILCDMSKAQDISNRYTVELAKKYRNDPDFILQQFSVPNGHLKTMEMELRVSPLVVEEVPAGDDIMNSYITQVLDGPTRQIVDNFIQKISEFLGNIETKTKTSDTHTTEEIRTAREKLAQKPWQRYLYHWLLDESRNAMGSPNKKSHKSKMSSIYADLEKLFFDHPDFLSLDIPKEQIDAIRKELRERYPLWVDSLAESFEAYRSRLSPPTIVSEIGSVGDMSAITIKITTDLRGYKWVINADDVEDPQTKKTLYGILTEEKDD